MKKINLICIIDDDPITVFGIKKMLKSVSDCDSIDTYSNGKLALDGIKNKLETTQQVPEVIFLDINMPIIDGWQFLDEFITLPASNKARINIITSSIDPADRAKWEYFKLKTTHTITFNYKPLQKQDLFEITKIA